MRLKNVKEVRQFTFNGEKQTRAINDVSTGETNQRYINGYAAVFNQPSKLIAELDDDNGTLITFFEVLTPSAFDDVLRAEELDVIYCIDHKQSKIVARTKANTLQISVDEYGLRFNAVVPDTTIANDLYENIRQGNYQDNSFCFIVEPDGETWEEREDGLYRFINRVSGLYDVSSVVNPAYNGTSLSVRGLDELKKRSKPALIEPNESPDLVDLEIFLVKNKQMIETLYL